MFQLVYASTSVKLYSDDELREMLGRFRVKNARLGITGMLIYKDGSFVQALEGEEAAVRALYETVRQDPRHHHVVELTATAVPARQFSEWCMRFQDLGAADAGGAASGSRLDPGPSRAEENLSWQAAVARNLLSTC